ncbi:MAG: aminotransferase class I/II-fold pyridoxal phosphate-dependent enzyme [Gemmatimonadota bacterium]
MTYLPPFAMERWQSHHEHYVEHNLSDSGVHPLSLGEVLQLTQQSLAEIRLGYTQSDGTPGLKSAIAALYDGATEANVVVTTGGAEANMVAVWELVRPGDRVVIVQPAYGQIGGLVRGLGGEVVGLPLRESLGWQPEPGAAADLISADTRLVVVTNPNNPTGAILNQASRDELLAAAARAGAWVLADEVYTGAELAREPTPSLWGDYERVVATNSLSKAYGVPGLRIGWLIAPEDLKEKCWARKDYTTIAPSALSDSIAAAVLQPEVRAALLSRTRGILVQNLALVSEWVAALGSAFTFRPPDAGAICYLRYAFESNSTELAEQLRMNQSLLIVPGDHFGMDGYLRLGFGLPEAELDLALVRLGEGVRLAIEAGAVSI